MQVVGTNDRYSRNRHVLDNAATLDSLMKRRMFGSHTRLWLNPGHAFRIQEQERHILKLLAEEGFDGLEHRRIVDLGCGFGFWLNGFIKWGAQPSNVFGVDLMPERIEYAREVCPERVTLECRSADHLPFEDGSFDLVSLFLLISQVKEASARERIANEAVRILRPGGVILWYDYRSLLEREFIPFTRRRIRELFRDCDIRLRSISPLGPLVRRIAPYSWTACQLLSMVAPLRTHYIGVIKPRAKAAAPSRQRRAPGSMNEAKCVEQLDPGRTNNHDHHRG